MNLIVPAAKTLTTRQLNRYSRGVRIYKDDNIADYLKAPLVELCTVSVQAAVFAGWFGDDVKVDDVEKMTPSKVVALGKDTIKAFRDAQNLTVVEKN